MKSIRTFLVIVLISTITLVMFLAALRGYQESVAQAERLFDAELMQELHLLGKLIDDQISRRPPADGDYQIDPNPYLHLTVFDEEYQLESAFQIWNERGELLLKSATAPAYALTGSALDSSTAAIFHSGFSDINYQGYRWRALTDFNSTTRLWIVVAERHDIRYALADSIILESLLPLIIALPLLALLTWAVVSFGLNPLRTLAANISEKEATDLSPLPTQQIPSELITLTRSVNELFRRLAESFEREKRFTADAAHELRNPLAALKIHAANLLAEARASAANASGETVPSETLIQLNRGIDRLSRLVEQLLTLNRMAPDHYLAQMSNLDLYATAQKVIQDLFPDLQKKSQSIELLGEPTTLYGDVFGIEILLQNLIGNASKYCPNGAHIAVYVELKNGAPLLRVVDNGPGIPEFERERVFERFYRIGGDRHSSNTTGSGLGLSIVRQIADLHGAQIELAAPPQGGLEVIVRFTQGKQTGELQ
ncbi:MAG: ATP-binding protein [Spongiibacteraceae bacterium]